jgi:hypothetical protein
MRHRKVVAKGCLADPATGLLLPPNEADDNSIRLRGHPGCDEHRPASTPFVLAHSHTRGLRALRVDPDLSSTRSDHRREDKKHAQHQDLTGPAPSGMPLCVTRGTERYVPDGEFRSAL